MLLWTWRHQRDCEWEYRVVHKFEFGYAWSVNPTNGHITHILITLRAVCDAVYCNRRCLCVCVFVCGSVTTITRNCVHQTGLVGKGSDHHQFVCVCVCFNVILWSCHNSLCMYVCYVYFNKDQSINQSRSINHQLIKFWPSCAPGKGICGGAKIFSSASEHFFFILNRIRRMCWLLIFFPLELFIIIFKQQKSYECLRKETCNCPVITGLFPY